MRTSPTGSQTGFTLLEVLLAVTVSSIVVTAAYAVFHTAMTARRTSLEAVAPLKQARFAFATLARDLRALHPDCQPKDLDCRGQLCRFPILDAHGERQWIRYRLQDGDLLREEYDPQPQAGAAAAEYGRVVAAARLADVNFGVNLPKTGPGARVLPRTIDLSLTFHGAATPIYNYTVLLEMQPENVGG